MRSHEARPEESLAAAYAEATGCPAPEIFLKQSWNELTGDQRARIETHARSCPACASERELARHFDASTADPDEASEDVDWVVSRLTERQRSSSRHRVPAWGFAAAAVLVLGIAAGLLAFRPPGPALPEPGSVPSVMRSTGIRELQPTGDIPDFPDRLSWSEVAGVEKYRVRIRGVDDRILWEKTVRQPEVALPEELRRAMFRAVLYRWSVEAYDSDESLIARSGQVEFRIVIEANER
jgi:hypothetical protein